MKSYVAVFFLVLSFQTYAEPLAVNRPWTNISDPLIMSATFLRSFSDLPLEGAVTDQNKYWSGDYWALKHGNINYRWNAPKPQGFHYRSPTKSEVMSLSLLELSYLAPSEKYDLLLGLYDYPLRKEVERFTSPTREIWEGICQGWALSLMHHQEPQPRTLKNPDGIDIPFGSSDIKALLSYYYAYKYSPVTSRQMGYRCSRSRWPWGGDRCTDDLNAGAFHIVLTNKIGLEGQSFVADIDNAPEVWNHVPVSYQMTILQDNLPPESDSARGTVKTVRVKSDVFYVFNSEKNSWEPVIGTPDQVIKKRSYDYTLDLNAEGIIVGGNWKSRMRPDFLWLVDRAPAFLGKWHKLHELVD